MNYSLTEQEKNEQWSDEENFIIPNNYEPIYKGVGTIDVHLANSKLTSVFDNFYVFNENPIDNNPNVSSYNTDTPIQSHNKVKWEK